MAKKSKARRRDRKKKRQEWEEANKLEKLAQIKEKTMMPSYVATNATIDDWEEHRKAENYHLTFASYNTRQCEIHLIDKRNIVRPFIEVLQQVTSLSPNTIGASGLIRDNINNDGEYRPLFKTVPEDVELKEISFSGTGRIYFYCYKNYFCVVAIQKNHRNT